jgi:hypothetical protein
MVAIIPPAIKSSQEEVSDQTKALEMSQWYLPKIFNLEDKNRKPGQKLKVGH